MGARADLQTEHLGWATRTARLYAAQMLGPAHDQFEDLVQEGVVGFVEACGSFDVSRGVPLEAFAMYRIRGAILDFARRQDHLSRTDRAAVREGEERGESRFFRDGREIVPFAPAPLDEEVERIGVEDDDVGVLIDVETAMSALSPRLRRVVLLHYWVGMTQRAIGTLLGVSETRINQMLADAHRRGALALESPVAPTASGKAPSVPKREPGEKPLLTDRENEVLQLIADGFSTDLIAKQLFLSPETVKSHSKHVLTRLVAVNRSHAVAIGFRLGLIQ